MCVYGICSMSIRQTPNSKLSDLTLFLCSICSMLLAWLHSMAYVHTLPPLPPIHMPRSLVTMTIPVSERMRQLHWKRNEMKKKNTFKNRSVFLHTKRQNDESAATTKYNHFKLFNKILPWLLLIVAAAVIASGTIENLPRIYAVVCASTYSSIFFHLCNRENWNTIRNGSVVRCEWASQYVFLHLKIHRFALATASTTTTTTMATVFTSIAMRKRPQPENKINFKFKYLIYFVFLFFCFLFLFDNLTIE